jgi:hypothetical protein
VAGRFIDQSGPLGTAFDISQTNSLRPHPTACAFGTNFLVAWSREDDSFPWSWGEAYSNTWSVATYGRIVSSAGNALSNELAIGRNIYWNTNPAIGFGNGSFFVAWATTVGGAYDEPGYLYQGQQRVRRLLPDGTPSGYPVLSTVLRNSSLNHPRTCFGQGQFCVLYPVAASSQSEFVTTSIMFAPQTMPEPTLIDLQRTTNAGITVQNSSASAVIEVSTNLLNWRPSHLSEVPTLSGLSQLFVRSYDRKWQCIEQLRSIDAAKQQWAFEKKKVNSDYPVDFDLYGPFGYMTNKPACPHNGTYDPRVVYERPQCTIAGHTL